MYRFLDELVTTEEKPVSFREFVTSPDYCNEDSMYEYWLGQEVREDTNELILDGSLGGGKSTYASFRFVYFLYTLFLKGPKLRKWLGVAENSPLYALYFSVSMTQAERSGFKQIRNIIDGCKWFTDNYPRDKNIDSEIRFPNDVSIIFASGEGHQISLNIIAFILDEANFRKGVGKGMAEEYSQVTQLYSQLFDRLITRFQTTEGLKAFAVLISSASYQTSFVEERKMAVRDEPTTQIITTVGYKVKPQNYSKEMFEVFIGTDTLKPQIIETQEQKDVLVNALGMAGLKSLVDRYFVKVPVDLKKPFLQHIELALQNHAGIPTQVQGRLVTNLSLVQDSYYKPERRMFSFDQITLSNNDDFQLIDAINSDIIRPEAPHYFFLDLSVQKDSGGFTCVRDDTAYVDGDASQKQLTHVFTLEVVPPPFPAQTKIRKFHQFMVDISQIVNVQGFATDQYQSTQLRQDIQEELGLTNIRISIDSSDEPFLLWLMMLVENRMKMLYHPTLHKEIKEAVHDVKRRRVVKAPNSTDDCFQSLVGAAYLAEVSESIQLPEPVNLVGSRSIKRLIKSLGYK